MRPSIHQIFGSENSLDLDLVFFVEEMPETILEKFSLSKKLCESITTFYSEKKINANLAVQKNGHLIEVYKGTTDELNNALFYTYQNHIQKFDNQITKLLVRDVDLKFLRSTRMILSFLSKTEYRSVIKSALKGDLDEKIEALEKIDLRHIDFFGKDTNDLDSIKSIAFQLGQAISLHDGKELYTKNEIVNAFPDLKKYLFREENTDFENLQQWLLNFIIILKTRSFKMKNKEEYKYEDENYIYQK